MPRDDPQPSNTTIAPMQLKVLLPTEVAIDRKVDKIIAESDRGYFCLLPRHIDIVAPLVPGLLSFTCNGEETFLAIDSGFLIKCDRDVWIATSRAVCSSNLETLRQAVAQEFVQLDDREKQTRSALARLEAATIRRFQEIH